jgi:RNA polymerase sigma-70 factor (ECF subfamily)
VAISPYSCAVAAWQQHNSEIHAYLVHRLAEPALAEDLLQEVFVKALKRGPQFCEIANPRAWLFHVARNAVADHFRLRKSTIPLADDLPQQESEKALADIFAGCLDQVLGELSDEDASIIRLCDISGMKLTSFADQYRITTSAAKSRIQRARRRLREIIIARCLQQIEEAGFASDNASSPQGARNGHDSR